MAELRVIARAEARNGSADELKSLLGGLVKPTRAEAGCKYSELFESNLPGVLYFNELWQSQAHLDAHAASGHFKEIFGKAKPLLPVPFEVGLLKSVE